ncbi:MAG: cysteine--tRNA ligase [Lachnospiraceae bacterium]|nr:cysteine--tRNA ligase [Lachnospiraceae bacterium]
MKIYNTLNNKKEELVPIEEGKIRMYVCGPTVYNYIHIGNARPMIVFDTVRRYLEYKGYEVNYVSNFTDVDDKIIAKANEEGVTAAEIAERYTKACLEDMNNMNVMPATVHPKATEEIDGMIEMIQTLIDKGYAYEKNGTVFYRTRKFQGYGKLSGKNLDDLNAGIRIAVDDEKEDPMDFVLWKPKKEGEPSWASPWSDGRPGWHIECSVMSNKYLGSSIDIHAGGEDLVFPHHENEIAQSEAANGVPFSNYWMHNAFLNINNHKMSKSAGNFFTVKDIAEKYPLQVLRFFMLNAHYRSPLNFSDDLMNSASSSLERICNSVSNLKHIKDVATARDFSDDDKNYETTLNALSDKFDAAMDDDFNTADAIAAIFEIVKLANSYITSDSPIELVNISYDRIVKLCDILGIICKKEEEMLDEEVEALINERQNARKERNFARADEIRDELLAKGIVLEDTREGVRWKRS